MKLTQSIEQLFKKFLPSPFTIAVLLSILSFLIALLFTRDENTNLFVHGGIILSYWEQGLWNSSLLVFTVQMMLMLVLGHVLAISKFANKCIQGMTAYCKTTANAAFIVCLTTLLMSLINWSLGLIFGAIFARKVAENAKKNNLPLHYPIIGACGYSGLMVWHGGISGSAPLKTAEVGHMQSLMNGIYSHEQIEKVPEILSFSDTVFSSMNITMSLVLLIIIPSIMYLMAKQRKPQEFQLTEISLPNKEQKIIGAEKLDHSKILASIIGGTILVYAFYKAIILPEVFNLNFINPNFINFTLLGLGIFLHGNFHQFLSGINQAIVGVSGILIQFPFYFGIMGIMKHSGLIHEVSDFFVSISTESSLPIFTFLSSGLVNIFVPSGGGQWAIQGPIIIEASQQLGISLSKNVMALVYGDQLTNMLQPFWALPLLGITGLKAKEILPYTLVIMFAGGLIFIAGLLAF